MSTLLRVVPDNYGEWRWTYFADGQVLMSSYSSRETRDEALEDAENALKEAGVTAEKVFLDGLSERITDKMRPPKVDAILEARKGGYASEGQDGIANEEQQRIKKELVQKAIDADVAAAKKKEARSLPPDIGEEQPKERKKPVKDDTPNPLAAQRNKAKAMLGE